MSHASRIDIHDHFSVTPHAEVPDWVNDYFRQVSRELIELERTLVEPTHVEPFRKFDGLFVFADGDDFNPGKGRGVYYWSSQVNDDEDIEEEGWIFVGSGGVAARPGENMNWRNVWTQDLYYRGDVVRDNEWLMIANKDTTARPAPQPIGLPSTSMPDIPAWDAIATNTSVIYSGHIYDFSESGWITSLRVWAPEVTANTNYRVILIDNTFPSAPVTTVIEEPVLAEDDWTVIGVGRELVFAGSQWILVLDALNSGSDTQVTGGWAFDGVENTTNPPAQNWNVSQQANLIRIDKTDLDSTDRSAELLGIIIDSTIQFVETATPANFVTYLVEANPIDNGSAVTYVVTQVDQGGTVPVGVNTTMTASIPIADSTQYRELVGNWPGGNPTWADVNGFLEYDGTPQAGHEDDAYGVDIEFQPATASQDWDLMAVSDLV